MLNNWLKSYVIENMRKFAYYTSLFSHGVVDFGYVIGKNIIIMFLSFVMKFLNKFFHDLLQCRM